MADKEFVEGSDLTLFGAARARNAAWPPGRARLIVLAVQAQTGVGGGGAYQAMEKLVGGAGALAAMRQVHPGTQGSATRS